MFASLQRYALLAVAILVPGLMLLAWAMHHRAESAEAKLADKVAAYERLKGALDDQKAEADGKLRVARENAAATTRALTEFQEQQRKTDETNRATVDDLRTRLLAVHAARMRDEAERARRGAGSGGTTSADPAGAGDRAGNATSAAGVLPAPPTGAGDAADDAFAADTLNIAFAACRADAISLRAALAPAP